MRWVYPTVRCAVANRSLVKIMSIDLECAAVIGDLTVRLTVSVIGTEIRPASQGETLL